MNWLKSDKPAKPPAAPEHADLEELMDQAIAYESMGIVQPGTIYIREHAPRPGVDRWGELLPLSAVEQDRLDRMTAVLRDPLYRTKALLRSGTLSPDEVDAIATAFPEIYAELYDQTIADMIAAKPPFPSWAEGVLAVFFMRPAADVYPAAPPPPSAGQPSQVAPLVPTQAERREIAVREQRR
jgi:hypothetical protein